MTARSVVLVALLALAGVVALAPEAAASCVFDPQNPVPGVRCGVERTVRCVKGIVEDGTCPV